MGSTNPAMNSYAQRVSASRKKWRESQPQRCMNCGSRRWLEVHEIERKAQAPRAWGHVANYLLLCAACHHGEFDTMSHSQQLALKWLKDREHYDLEQWLSLKPRPSTYVTQEEVSAHVRQEEAG